MKILWNPYKNPDAPSPCGSGSGWLCKMCENICENVIAVRIQPMQYEKLNVLEIHQNHTKTMRKPYENHAKPLRKPFENYKNKTKSKRKPHESQNNTNTIRKPSENHAKTIKEAIGNRTKMVRKQYENL